QGRRLLRLRRLRPEALRLQDQVRRLRLALVLGRPSGRGRQASRPGSHLLPLRRPPGPHLRRRPAPDRQAPLNQFPLAPVCGADGKSPLVFLQVSSSPRGGGAGGGPSSLPHSHSYSDSPGFLLILHSVFSILVPC